MPAVTVVGEAAVVAVMVLETPRVVYLGPTVLRGAEQAWMGCLLLSWLLLLLPLLTLLVLPASSSPFLLSLLVPLW